MTIATVTAEVCKFTLRLHSVSWLYPWTFGVEKGNRKSESISNRINEYQPSRELHLDCCYSWLRAKKGSSRDKGETEKSERAL